jgi:hypothetical protein
VAPFTVDSIRCSSAGYVGRCLNFHQKHAAQLHGLPNGMSLLDAQRQLPTDRDHA